MQANPTLSPAIEEELSYLREEKSKIPDLEAKVEKLKAEAESYTETAMKVAALESEREQLVDELETLKEKAAQSDESAAEQSLKLEIVKLQEALEQKNDEVARLRVSIESSQDEGSSDPATREEIDQLTGQIADQLMAIQNFESMLQKAREQLEEKDKEIASLKEKLHQAGVSEDKVIPVTGDSEIISGFIDFFDGLDSMLVRNPIPELQTLHQKLLDRLIIPNQISYVPVISEQFDPEKHIATDYFRTDKFPEKCVVFEVEKGYAKGDTIIKKAKVWVVQNLFECQECKAMQSNPDSRFCHMCGAKMVAPNGLPVDNLPEFEPTPATYQRFAERMIEKDETEKAKDYLKQGLELDANFVPLLVKLGEILGAESEFEEALELLKKAYNLKQDRKIQEKISAIEVKLNIYKQAKSLHLDPEEFSKLVNLIKK
jgi:molecular chaperone GrpE (heat shock protein)